ncbi:MAG: hypothetical protein LBF81_00255 [Prevotellaceae bacterium]|nr:hypothetical protein [Prevotellaceae bacterium]
MRRASAGRLIVHPRATFRFAALARGYAYPAPSGRLLRHSERSEAESRKLLRCALVALHRLAFWSSFLHCVRSFLAHSGRNDDSIESGEWRVENGELAGAPALPTAYCPLPTGAPAN